VLAQLGWDDDDAQMDLLRVLVLACTILVSPTWLSSDVAVCRRRIPKPI
jgi:hypothetical protein